MKLITGRQIAAARALSKISAEELAKLAQLGVATVRRAEAADGQPNITAANLAAIRTALEAAGVIFVDENGEGPGVRLRKRVE
ncbi:transcriptional regulator [Pseudochelatococcus sp. B33]